MPLLALLLTAAGIAVEPATVPFEVLKTRHVTLMVKVNGKGPYRVLFDTGAPLNVLSREVARECGLNTGDEPGSRVKVRSLEVGELKADDVPVVILDHPAAVALSRTAGPVHGILGFAFFGRYRMTLDYQARQMTFVPSGFDPPDTLQSLLATLASGSRPTTRVLAPAAQWGLVVDKAADDEEAGVTVQTVRPDSAAAAAGLRPGDRLLTMDGRWTDSVADCYHAAGHVPPDQAVPVVVRRDGREIRLTVRPRSGI